MKRRSAAILLTLLLCMALPRAYASVTASLSATRVASGTTVQLTLTYDGLTTSDPDIAPLRKDFDILGTSSSTRVQIGTGGSAETTQVVLSLAPKRTGQLTIPSISWDGEHSAPLALTVGGGSAGAPGSGAPAAVFIVSRTTPAQPFVQAQVRLTVQIYSAERLYHGSLDFSGSSAVLVKHVGADQYGAAVRNGRTYQVITRRFVLFPLHSGRIRLPGPVLEADIAARTQNSPWSNNPFGGFFGGLMQTLRPIEVHGVPIVLSVRPRPQAATGRDWLPAQTVTLTAHWSPRTLSAQAGNPLTLQLDLTAAGLTAAQLPDLAHRLASPAGVSTYPDQAKLQDSDQGTGIVGSRKQTIAFIADHPGHYRLPALTVRWWNTHTDQLQTATLPARTLNFTPAAASTSATASPAAPSAAAPPPTATRAPSAPAPSAAPSPASHTETRGTFRGWPWLAAALAVLWVATVGAWFWSRRRRSRPAAPPPQRAPRPEPAAERTAFHTACTRNDPAAARRHLLRWMSAAWGVPATSLSPLIEASRDVELVAQLRRLERACYGGGSWQGTALAQALRELPARPGRGAPPKDTLPPLYP